MWAIYTSLEIIQNGQHYIKWRIIDVYEDFREASFNRDLVFDGECFRLGFASGEELEVYEHFINAFKPMNGGPRLA